MHRVRCKSGLMGWRDRLRNQYLNFEEFRSFSEMYGLHERLDFKTASDAWEKNPLVEGSVNPSDYRTVREHTL